MQLMSLELGRSPGLRASSASDRPIGPGAERAGAEEVAPRQAIAELDTLASVEGQHGGFLVCD